ncbi:hypothetical protein HK104_004624, partial [Borealophlyctis nickersoniae]
MTDDFKKPTVLKTAQADDPDRTQENLHDYTTVEMPPFTETNGSSTFSEKPIKSRRSSIAPP